MVGTDGKQLGGSGKEQRESPDIAFKDVPSRPAFLPYTQPHFQKALPSSQWWHRLGICELENIQHTNTVVFLPQFETQSSRPFFSSVEGFFPLALPYFMTQFQNVQLWSDKVTVVLLIPPEHFQGSWQAPYWAGPAAWRFVFLFPNF